MVGLKAFPSVIDFDRLKVVCSSSPMVGRQFPTLFSSTEGCGFESHLECICKFFFSSN